MQTAEILEEIERRAFEDAGLRETILETRNAKDPLDAFCTAMRAFGYEIYPMEVVMAGEEFYASYRRSTNGGGENSPKLAGEDDFYEMMIAALSQEDRKQE